MPNQHDTPYDAAFFESQSSTSRASARVVVPMLIEHFRPTSVVDVGCGVGTWAAEFREQGVSRVAGIDGDYVQANQLQIPEQDFISANLAADLPDVGRFDLALSLEVAEHLPPDRSATFVADLVRLADVVVFSAAIPGQGGVDHLAERWQDEWADMFAAHDYEPIDLIRSRIWDNADVSWWYRQNLLVYVRRDAIELPDAATPPPLPLRIVHPKAYAGVVYHLDPDHISTRSAVRQLQHSFRRAVDRRLRGNGAAH